MAILKRVSDGKGDMGACSQAIEFDEDGKFKRVVASMPTVGYSMLVGSVTARSYSDQDYWLTTPVTELLVDEPDYVKFRTGNSVYEWWK
jgi:hypothetical protein